MQDAVGVDVEGHFDLRNAARGRWNPIKVENAELFVVTRQRPLALQHFDLHARLIVAVSRKDLRLPRRDSGVTWDHRRGYAARGFDREREWRHIKEEHVFDVAFEHAALNGCANRYDFIRIHTLVRLLADKIARNLNHFRHACHTADE